MEIINNYNITNNYQSGVTIINKKGHKYKTYAF